jgi:hypothetical protein
MDTAIQQYEQIKAMLGSASPAWEKLVGYIRYHYVMDEKWVEGKPTHKNYNNLFIRRSGKSFIMLSIREGYFIAGIVLRWIHFRSYPLSQLSCDKHHKRWG